MLIFGYNANAVKDLCIKIFFVRAGTVLSIIKESRQRKACKRRKKLLIISKTGDQNIQIIKLQINSS